MKRGLLLLFVAVLAFPAVASAFVRSTVPGTGICLWWDTRDIPWTLNDQGAESVGFEATQQAVRASFDEWQRPDCSDLSFTERTPTASTVVGFDRDDGDRNLNLLVWRPVDCEDVAPGDDPCWDDASCGNEFDCWDFGPGTIAVTTTTFRQDTGEILDGDIEFNAANFLFTTVDRPPCDPEAISTSCVATDIQNTATHEIGHLIGFDHSTTRGSTMLATARIGDTFMRSLLQDDEVGLCTVYPTDGPTLTCTGDNSQGQNGDGGCNCGAADGAGGLGLLFVGATLLRGRRRRA